MRKILIACEESQAVTIEMRKLGWEAYSCDIEPCSGGHPEWHLQQDVIPLLRDNWDLIIAFPPCTHLAFSGARHFKAKREDGRQQAGINFFMQFAELDCPYAIENPVGIMSTLWRKLDQIIQPWQFGDAFEKKTCLWLKNLPKLKFTEIVEPPQRTKFRSGKSMPTWYADAKSLPKKEQVKVRSKTFPGIAKALAAQYTAFLDSKMTVTEWENS